jgi:hypothetical protein
MLGVPSSEFILSVAEGLRTCFARDIPSFGCGAGARTFAVVTHRIKYQQRETLGSQGAEKNLRPAHDERQLLVLNLHSLLVRSELSLP